MSLVARYLEAHGMPTVIIGSALDIVERCGVPRFLFVDFPLKQVNIFMRLSVSLAVLVLFSQSGDLICILSADIDNSTYRLNP